MLSRAEVEAHKRPKSRTSVLWWKGFWGGAVPADSESRLTQQSLQRTQFVATHRTQTLVTKPGRRCSWARTERRKICDVGVG